MMQLKDGRRLEVAVLTVPLKPEDRMRLVSLLEHEWERSDVDWLQSMRGAYGNTLQTHSAMGSIDGDPVANATVAYPKREAEVCVVENVMTRPEFRRQGIGAVLTERMVQVGFEANCRLAYLGNEPRPRAVYEKIGFRRISGAIMRLPAPGYEQYEVKLFAPGQSTTIRPSSWGDLPGLACLMGQPSGILMADYLRGLVSRGQAVPLRCVSNFTSVWYDVQAHRGLMLTLAGEMAHRVLGFASLTPGPAPLRQHTAVIDAATHDHYADQLVSLIDSLTFEARRRQITQLHAYVASSDSHKLSSFQRAGFSVFSTLPGMLHLKNRTVDIVLLQRCLKPTGSLD